MSGLKENLDFILEDSPQGTSIDSTMAIAGQLQKARQLVLGLTHRLEVQKGRLAAELAIAVRRAKPSLNIALDRQGCKIGYKTKHLSFTPDFEQGYWRVTSPNRRFLREFLKAHNRATIFANDLAPLIQAIIDYFGNYYRTLGEELSGTGVILVEGSQSNLLGLANWHDSEPVRPLLTRKTRLGVMC